MTHAEFEYELVEALNMLLEDERASVEMEVALASGATEYMERDALATMGMEDIHFCALLRDEMERAGLPVTPQINGVVFQVIDAERYDDRLRAFARHQRSVAERATELQESNLDGALREALEDITATHERHTQWIERRADDFAATRTLEFGGPGRSVSPGADATATVDEVTLVAGVIEEPQREAPGEEQREEPGEEPGEAFGEASAVSEPVASSAEQPAEVAAPVTPAEEAKPKARATRATPRTTTRAKSVAKPTTKTTTTTKAKAAAKPKPASTTAPRRTRRAPEPQDTGEV